MTDLTPFQKVGQWYKAALHVHTTRSDGKLAPEVAMAAYHEQGYHVLAVTDHHVITDLSSFSTPDFLNIPSVEVNFGRNEVGQSYHLVILGVRDMLELPHETPVEQVLAEWRTVQQREEIAPVIFLAHPYWSGMTTSEMMALDGLTGLEIYNTSAYTDLGKGMSTVHWDQVLARGKRWWGYAVDDVHWMRRYGRFAEAFGGWVWIKAEALEKRLILEALRHGHFYASSGPQLFDFRVEDGVAYAQCSEVVAINFIGHTQWGSQHEGAPGSTITEAQHRLTGDERYLRVQCVDILGRSAWSNPVFLS